METGNKKSPTLSSLLGQPASDTESDLNERLTTVCRQLAHQDDRTHRFMQSFCLGYQAHGNSGVWLLSFFKRAGWRDGYEVGFQTAREGQVPVYLFSEPDGATEGENAGESVKRSSSKTRKASS